MDVGPGSIAIITPSKIHLTTKLSVYATTRQRLFDDEPESQQAGNNSNLNALEERYITGNCLVDKI